MIWSIRMHPTIRIAITRRRNGASSNRMLFSSSHLRQWNAPVTSVRGKDSRTKNRAGDVARSGRSRGAARTAVDAPLRFNARTEEEPAEPAVPAGVAPGDSGSAIWNWSCNHRLVDNSLYPGEL